MSLTGKRGKTKSAPKLPQTIIESDEFKIRSFRPNPDHARDGNRKVRGWRNGLIELDDDKSKQVARFLRKKTDGLQGRTENPLTVFEWFHL